MILTPLVGTPLFNRPGLGSLLLILVVILILFGGSKLPQLGKGLGEGIRNFKKGLKGDDEPSAGKEPSSSKEIEKEK